MPMIEDAERGAFANVIGRGDPTMETPTPSPEPTPTPTPTPEPTPTPTPAPAPAPQPASQAQIDALAQLQRDTNAALADLSKSFVEARRSEGDERPEETIISELSKENEHMGTLAKRVIDMEGELKQLRASESQRQASEQERAEKAAAEQQIVAEATRLTQTFPGLSTADVQKCLNEIATNDAVGAMSMREVAEQVLGYDYLHARRSKPTGDAPGNDPKPLPTAPVAAIVPHAVPGAGPNGGAPIPDSGGGLRDVFAQMRVTDAQKVGRYK